MKKYNIKVNGTSYEVEVEEIMEKPEVRAPQVTQAPAPGPEIPAHVPEKKKPAEVPSGETAATAPMPGTILDVMVTEGQQVEEGEVLLILEAMKMENEIQAPCAGTVCTVAATKGASVNAGEVLATIK